ncbi:MAG TPA: hypothetical protein H9890_09250 [Candidatus Faecalibacterium intestinigallinarum]|uniref:HNH endonuclease n=1 Tax=Candidatus Faecalibacterium intestinigallinarum TaxID=2838581 RepID=A0A9D1QCE1_9FIRM|nr:hypothetical protein [Candidatus Faecalibacterium intestinigallinarum]
MDFYDEMRIKILYARSGYQCEFLYEGGCRCQEELYDNVVSISNVYRIKDDSNRSEKRESDSNGCDNDDASNLILLCPKHHDEIRSNRFYNRNSVLLRYMKREGEKPVSLYLKSYEGNKFLRKLNEIFDKYEFDNVFDELTKSTLPYINYLNIMGRIENGCESIKGLKNKKCTVEMPEGFKTKLLFFAERMQRMGKYIQEKSYYYAIDKNMMMLYNASKEGRDEVNRVRKSLYMEYMIYRNTYQSVCELTD